MKDYKYRQYSNKELAEIYKKLSLIEDVMEKNLIETPEMLDIRLSENRNVNKMFETKLTDLEVKLAESEKEHELLIDQFEEETEKLRKQIKQESDARKRFVEAHNQLKQQLAEKEKEISQLYPFIKEYDNGNFVEHNVVYERNARNGENK